MELEWSLAARYPLSVPLDGTNSILDGGIGAEVELPPEPAIAVEVARPPQATWQHVHDPRSRHHDILAASATL
jgi:hypothetical protein